MGYYGCEFVFNGRSCKEFGLVVYNLSSSSDNTTTFTSSTGIVEEKVPGRYDTLYYGTPQNDPLEFELEFGANMESIDYNSPPTRYDVDVIASWLTGYKTRQWLDIIQDDTAPFRFLCSITDLKLVTTGSHPWSFLCTVHCDSPFAYTYPVITDYTVDGELNVYYNNRSAYRGYFYPRMKFSISGGGSIQVINNTDGGRSCTISGIPVEENLIIEIDSKNQIIRNSGGYNLYHGFNKKFPRLLRGGNSLTLKGDYTAQIISVFPVNIGG